MTPPKSSPPVSGVHFRLDLPFEAPHEALRGNYKGHWSGRHQASREVREAVVTAGKSVGLRRYGAVPHVTARVTWAPGNRHRRDAGNLYPFSKAAIDGLTPSKVVRRKSGLVHYVGLGLVWDDTPEWVTELTPIILPPPDKGLWLDVWVHLEKGRTNVWT